MALQNVEVIQQEAHKKTWFQRFRKSAKYSLVVPTMLAVNAYAADAPAAPETTSIITYIGLVVDCCRCCWCCMDYGSACSQRN